MSLHPKDIPSLSEQTPVPFQKSKRVCRHCFLSAPECLWICAQSPETISYDQAVDGLKRYKANGGNDAGILARAEKKL